jgi:hypothetical protein
MKIMIGFVFGLMVASAIAQTLNGITSPPFDPMLTLAAGTDPDHHAAPINVDKDGYVICSTERKP